MSDLFEEYGHVLIAAIVGAIIISGLFLLFRGEWFMQWISSYAHAIGG